MIDFDERACGQVLRIGDLNRTMETERIVPETCVRHVEWLKQIDSTNNHALQMLASLNPPMPFLIGSDEQTAGRGRGANRWWGASGSLMFSLGVDMPALGLPPTSWPRFSLLTGLAVSETLVSFLPAARVGLKWPNDVWIDGRKVCGILIEQSDRAADRLVIGVGLNVNNSFQDASDEQRQIATSMTDAASGLQFSRTDVLITFLNSWRRLAAELADGDLNLVERWSHLCVLSGNPVMLTDGHRETTGICAGIDDDGSLLLRTAFSLERCYAGTVRLLT